MTEMPFTMKHCSLILAALLCAAFLVGCVPAPAADAIPTASLPAAPTPAPEPEYQYMSAEDAYTYIRLNHAPLIIDVQPQEYYDGNGHLEGAINTAAYPVNTDALQQKLAATVTAALEAESVLLVDMAGKAGARNAYDYYINAGVDAENLYILRNGMLGWSYPEAKIFSVAPYEPQYVKAKDVRNMLRKEIPLEILDLRDATAYQAAHLLSSVSVPAFAADADAYDIRTALAAELGCATKADANTVLVTAAGGDDALLACDFYIKRGADPMTLFILEEGMDGWPSSYNRYVEADETAEDADAQSETPAAEPAEAPAPATPQPAASEPTIPPEGIMG